MLKPFLLAGVALITVGLVYTFTRHGGFDENAPGEIVDNNGIRWEHWVDDLGTHHADAFEGLYRKAYGGDDPQLTAKTHDELMQVVSDYAIAHPLAGSKV